MKNIPILLALVLSAPLLSQKTTDTIVIKNHYGPAAKYNAVSTINGNTLSRSPFISAQDELSAVPNVNIQTRGVLGSQSDVSIRGGSFEQTAIYLNGIRINNPQTGHNQSAMSLSFQHYGEVQVVKSGSSKFFGGNAFAGAIFIESKKPEQSGLNGQLAVGSFNTTYAALQYNLVKKNHYHSFSGTFINSNGYRTNTDQRSYQYNQEHHVLFGKDCTWDGYVSFTFNSRAYGANGFYSLRFPNQYEEIQSYFYHAGVKNKNLKVDAYWNQVDDYYILKRENPAFYRNLHYTDTRGVMATYKTMLNDKISLTAQGEIRNEHTNSSNLGKRDRNIVNLNAHADWQILESLKLNAGGNFNYINGYDPFLTGGVNIAYHATKKHLFHGGFNTAYRIPTFTELYYTSFTDSGSAALNPETGRNLEIGYQYKEEKFSVEANAFKRWSSNQIDWMKPTGTASFYRSMNISSVQTFGVELSAHLHLNKILHNEIVEMLSVSYAFNELGIDSLANVRYGFNYLKNQAIAKLYLNYTKFIKHSVVARYEERSNLTYHYTMLDSKVEFCPTDKAYSFYVLLNNITDVKYENFPGIPMPGFNCMAGLQFRLK